MFLIYLIAYGKMPESLKREGKPMVKTRYTNEKKYGLSIAAWLGDDEYDHAPVDGPYISVTGLLKPLRQIVLAQRVRAKMAQSGAVNFIDIDRFVASRLGTAIHSSIEHSWTRKIKGREAFRLALKRLGYDDLTIERVVVNPTAEQLAKRPDIVPVYMEQRAFKKVGDYTIGGQFDFIGDGILEDFKSMAVYGYMKGDKDEEQLMQGSLYRWLNPELVTSDWMRIQQIFTDWSKMEARIKAKKGYPQSRIVEKVLDLMPYAKTDMWVKNRVGEIDRLMDVPEEDLPRCTQKELWQDDPVYKYYANPEKTTGRSTKNFDSFAEAQDHLTKKGVGVIKEVLGKVKRCGYCDGFDLCTQKDEYLAADVLQLP